MLRCSRLLILSCLPVFAAASLSAADEPVPTPSSTVPAPLNSTGADGIIVNESADSLSGGLDQPLLQPVEPEPRVSPEIMNEFRGSGYWAASQPFRSPRLSARQSGYAFGAGLHVRYPYYKYRAPWSYQGPRALSPTIHWQHAPGDEFVR